ncbi:MAG: hypothetical protein ACRDUA_26210, partial [Micromonosporaceae bacterium]
MAVLAGAGSTAVQDLLHGPPRTARVVGVHPTCVYVLSGPDLVVLETADGLALPCAVRLGVDRDAAPFGAVRPGQDAAVGARTVIVGRTEARVARWWEPRRPR